MKDNETTNEIIIYQGDDGQPIIDVRIQGETVWLNQAQLVELFQSSKANYNVIQLFGISEQLWGTGKTTI